MKNTAFFHVFVCTIVKFPIFALELVRQFVCIEL